MEESCSFEEANEVFENKERTVSQRQTPSPLDLLPQNDPVLFLCSSLFGLKNAVLHQVLIFYFVLFLSHFLSISLSPCLPLYPSIPLLLPSSLPRCSRRGALIVCRMKSHLFILFLDPGLGSPYKLIPRSRPRPFLRV